MQLFPVTSLPHGSLAQPTKQNAIVRFALLIPALALFLGSFLERPSGYAFAYDSIVYLLLAFCLLVIYLLFIRERIGIGTTTMLAALGGSLFFVSKLVYLLFFYLNPLLIPNEMTESLFWVPTI